MGPWSVNFIHNLSEDTWRFEAVHDNGTLTSKSDLYDSFEEAYKATIAPFSTPLNFNTPEPSIQEWITEHITFEDE